MHDDDDNDNDDDDDDDDDDQSPSHLLVPLTVQHPYPATAVILPSNKKYIYRSHTVEAVDVSYTV